jgi:hypothetical protein
MDGCQPGTGTCGGLCGGLGRRMRPESLSGKRFPRRHNLSGRQQAKATPIPGVAFIFSQASETGPSAAPTCTWTCLSSLRVKNYQQSEWVIEPKDCAVYLENCSSTPDTYD